MDDNADLSFAFGMPPEKAVDYFKSKGMVIAWDWWETWQEAHNKAFTVAKVTRMDILQDIRTAVDKTISEGTTYETFRRELEPKLKAKGWWGQHKVTGADGTEKEVTLGSPWRLRTIFRTNTQTALAAGRWKDFIANADKRPYLQFVCVLDSHTRPSHRLLHDKVFHISDPIWKKLAPPLDWGCRCRLRALTLEEVTAKGIKVSSSEGQLHEEDRLVSEATGEMKPVTVYTDPKTGKKVSTGVGWDYNPGQAEFKPDLTKYPQPVVNAFEKVVKAEGLAKRIPYKTDADIGKLLTQYDKENPGVFQLGFGKVEVKRSSDYLMATNKNGEIKISSYTFPNGLNSAQLFRSALKKIAKGVDLTFEEEDSIGSLWHEIGHCRSKGWPKLGERRIPNTIQVMETLNEWVTRHTYPDFLKQLGGEAKHQAEIMERGPGYTSMVRNFRSLLKRAGADEQIALGILKPLAIEEKWVDLPRLISEKVAGLMEDDSLVRKIQAGLGYIGTQSADEFERILKTVFGEAS